MVKCYLWCGFHLLWSQYGAALLFFPKSRESSGVNASSKLGGTKRQNVWGVGWCVPLPTGERSGKGNFFLLWSRNGIFWGILRY